MEPSPDPRLLAGTRLDNDGAFAVFRGVWKDCGRLCTLKLLAPGADRPVGLQRLRAEAQALQQVEGVASVPRLIHLDTSAACLVQALPPGTPLAAEPLPLSRERVVALGISLAELLAEVHAAGLMHLGLRPAAVLVDTDPQLPAAVALADFSRARMIAQAPPSADDVPLGAFCAPELTGRMGAGADARADLYSLGALLYWCASGRAPFDGADALGLFHAVLTEEAPPLSAEQPAVPECLSRVVAKLLRKRPQDRYQSARGVLSDLQRCREILAHDLDDADFQPGSDDWRSAPAEPSRLVGRDVEVAHIRQALLMAGNRAKLVVVHGASGVGKSALVHHVAAGLLPEGGILAVGKYDQLHRSTAFGGLAEALTAIAEALLTLPPRQLQEFRRTLLDTLGANAALLPRVAAGFDAVLWGPESRPVPQERADEETIRVRLKRCLGGLFRALWRTGKPVVLFIDDLQWAHANSLELIASLAAHTEGPGFVLMAAYRDDEPGADKVAGFVGSLKRSGIQPIDIGLAGLPPADTATLVADVLGAGVQPLADALHAKTGGNVFFVLQHLQRLARTGALRRDGSGWQWNAAAVSALADPEHLAEALLAELEALEPAARDLAGACACLGHWVDVHLLAEVQGVAEEAMLAMLQPLVERGILCHAADPLPKVQALPRLRFGHDRMQHAARALLGDEAAAQWHVRVGRVLARRSAGSADEPSVDAAGHYLAGLAALTGTAEKAMALGLFADAAERGLRDGAFQQALRFVDAARGLPAAAPAAGGGLRLAVTHHALLCATAQYEAADAAFAALSANAEAAGSLLMAEATARQCTALSNRTDYEGGVALALDCVRALGVDVPGDDGWAEAVAREIERLDGVLASGDGTPCPLDRVLQDVRLEKAMGLLVAAMNAAAQCAPLVSYWARLRLIRTGFERGVFEALPLALVSAPKPFISLRGDYATGHALAQHGLRLGRRYPQVWSCGGIHYRLGLHGHCFESLEACLDHALEVHRLCDQGGLVQYSNFTTYYEPALALETMGQLQDVQQVIDKAMARAHEAGDRNMADLCRAYQWFVSRMQGDPPAPDAAEGPESTDGHAVGPRDLRNAFLQAYFCCYQGLASALLGEWEQALRHARDGLAYSSFVDGMYVGVLLRWVHVLAACAGMRRGFADDAAAADVEAHLGWLQQRAVDAPVNFAHMQALAAAMKAWADGRTADAAAGFERAAHQARRHGRPYHAAWAQELAAQFCRDLGLSSAAAAYAGAAAAAYESWGARGKAQLLRGDAGIDGASRPVPSPAMAALDLQSVLKAGEVLAVERNPERVLAVLLALLQQYSAAEYGQLFWRHVDSWVPLAGFGPGGQRIVRPGMEVERMAPESIFNYATQSLRPLSIHDVQADLRFAADPLVAARGIKSVIALPLRLRGEAVGLLYMENRRTNVQVQPAQLQTLGFVGMQFAIAYENALVHERMDQQVQLRTRELRREIVERRKAEAAAVRAQRATTEFLARVSHEIRTPLNTLLSTIYLLQDEEATPQQQKYLVKADITANLLLNIVNDILDLSRLEAGKVTLEEVEFSPAKLAGDAVEMFHAAAQAKGLSLELQLDPLLPQQVIGDPLRLTQVLVNVLGNAVKFTEAGHVRVSVMAKAVSLRTVELALSVADSGIGLSPQQIEALFRPFAQGEASTARKFGGSGLGLAISKQFVELMGGRIWAVGEPSRGTTVSFTVRLALAQAAGADAMACRRAAGGD